MNLGQDLATLKGEFGSDGLQVWRANDPSSQGVAVEPLHDEAIAEAIGWIENMVDGWLGNTGRLGDLHELGFDCQPRPALGGAGLATGRSSQCQRLLSPFDGGDQAVRLLACSPGESFGTDKALEAFELSPEYLAQSVGEIRHGLFVAFSEGPRLLLVVATAPASAPAPAPAPAPASVAALRPALIGGLWRFCCGRPHGRGFRR